MEVRPRAAPQIADGHRAAGAGPAHAGTPLARMDGAPLKDHWNLNAGRTMILTLNGLMKREYEGESTQLARMCEGEPGGSQEESWSPLQLAESISS